MCSYALNSCIINTMSWWKARVCSIDIQRVVSLLTTQISVAIVTYIVPAIKFESVAKQHF